MQIVRPVRRGWSWVWLFLPLICAGCLGPVAGLYPPPPGAPVHDIYIVNNGWHTGIVLKTSELSCHGKSDLKRFAKYPWVEVGWGDADFYRAPKATASLALQAMFCSPGSVLHVVGVAVAPPQLSHS